MRSSFDRKFFIANIAIFSLGILCLIYYDYHGGLWLKGVTSSWFFLHGIINLVYAKKKGFRETKVLNIIEIGLFLGMFADVLLGINFMVGVAAFGTVDVFQRQDDPALLQHHDVVEGGHGAKAVGHHDGGAALAQFLQRGLNGHFGGVIQCGGRFVQNQDGRVFQEDPGDGDALLLSAGQLDAALTHLGVIAFFQRHNVVVDVCLLCRIHNLLIGGRLGSVGDIILNRTVKEKYALGYHANIFSKAVKSDVLCVHTVKSDSARVYTVKTRN